MAIQGDISYLGTRNQGSLNVWNTHFHWQNLILICTYRES